MTYFRTLPLDSTPCRRVTFTLAGQILTARTYYNQFDGGWFCDLYDVDLVPIVIGRALVPGIDLLRQFTGLDLGSLALIPTDGGDGQGLEDLGSMAQLVSAVD